MKVIQEGTLNNNWKTTETCKLCKSRIEICLEDLTTKETVNDDAVKYQGVFFQCPVCAEICQTISVEPYVVVKDAERRERMLKMKRDAWRTGTDEHASGK